MSFEKYTVFNNTALENILRRIVKGKRLEASLTNFV